MTVQRIHCSKKLISQWFHPAYSHQLLSTSVFHLGGFWSTQACFNTTRDCGSRFPVTYLHNRSAFQARDSELNLWAISACYFIFTYFRSYVRQGRQAFGTDSLYCTEGISDKICQFRLKHFVFYHINVCDIFFPVEHKGEIVTHLT